jgi:hypothetical protein
LEIINVNLFKSNNPHYEFLRKKWIGRNKDITQGLFDKHLHKVAAGSLGGLMLLSTPGLTLPAEGAPVEISQKITAATSKNLQLKKDLEGTVPSEMRNLNSDEEKKVADLLTNDLGIKVAAEIDNKRLNRTYGLIGGEQHLYRYPGDTVSAHAKTAADWVMYGPAGIAPGLGAWGYFAPSQAAFDQTAEDRERWYIAVQTFLSPGFAERTAEYRDFYKYRKMLVVNPSTGQAVVADIADAGPSEWTGKSLGGSPEVMHELGLATGPRKGAVLYFFVDDPDNKIPLGPVKITEEVK